ncbi:hypothetical protein MRX96_056146 [Rhipicephalus microplus]
MESVNSPTYILKGRAHPSTSHREPVCPKTRSEGHGLAVNELPRAAEEQARRRRLRRPHSMRKACMQMHELYVRALNDFVRDLVPLQAPCDANQKGDSSMAQCCICLF